MNMLSIAYIFAICSDGSVSPVATIVQGDVPAEVNF
jgi:hypothetical protein